MFLFSKLYALATLATFVSAAVVVRQNDIRLPGNQDKPVSEVDRNLPKLVKTNDKAIFRSAQSINQKSAPGVDELPNQEVPGTVVTVLDGKVTGKKSGPRKNGFSKSKGGTRGSKTRRDISDYDVVFEGTGTGPADRDAGIEGTAYLTFTLVSNATYNVEACLNFCSSVSGCVFANLYYEFNNYGLDFEATEQSNLKCVVYGDVHTAVEKTNFGGQQSYPSPAPTIYIQQSSGYAAKSLTDPSVPDGYEYVFGPIGGATSAGGYMGFAFLDKYDVEACAEECNQRGADASGGSCQFFNIWRAVVNGIPTTYSCSMYFIPTDASTATNTGQGSLQVTYSRGYRRINFVVDGGFEEIPCDGWFCVTESYDHWTATSEGFNDAAFYYYTGYARTGTGVAILGSGSGTDALPGTFTPAEPLNTAVGKSYRIEFWQSSSFNSPPAQAAAWFDVIWNGVVVLEVRPGYSSWSRYSVDVTAVGDDILAFHGGQFPAYSFVDDIAIWQL